MSAAELLFKHFPGRLRVYVAASDNRRIGNLMVDKRLERPAAKSLLAELDRSDRAVRAGAGSGARNSRRLSSI